MIETIVWVGLGLGLPWLGRWLRARWLDPQGAGVHDVEWLARAAYGVLLPFGAWASGALVGRELGLWAPWRGSAVWSLAAVAGSVFVGEWALRRGATRPALRRVIGEDRSLADLFDTPRWSLYRGAGLLWIGNPLLATLAGWFLAVLEDIGRVGRVPNPAHGRDRRRLLWLTASMIVLGLGGNLWVTLVAQAGCLWLMRANRR